MEEKLQELKNKIDQLDGRIRNGLSETIAHLQSSKMDKIPLPRMIGWIGAILIPAMMFAFWSGQKLTKLEADQQAIVTMVQLGTDDRYRKSQADADHKLLVEKYDFAIEKIDDVKEGLDQHRILGGHSKMEQRMSVVEDKLNRLEQGSNYK